MVGKGGQSTEDNIRTSYGTFLRWAPAFSSGPYTQTHTYAAQWQHTVTKLTYTLSLCTHVLMLAAKPELQHVLSLVRP